MTKLDTSPLNYVPGSASAVRRFRFPRQPTNVDYKNFRLGDEWLDEASSDWWKMTERTNTAGLWVRIGGTTGDIASLTGDSGGLVGPDGAHNIDVLGNPDIDIVGTPGTNSFQLTNLTKYTPYVVDSVAGAAPYQTIQSAMDAANAAGGGVVLVRSGTYLEQLTFYDNVSVRGTVRIASANPITVVGILGAHSVPASGTISITSLLFVAVAPGNILENNNAGTTTIWLNDCRFITVNGYSLYVPLFDSNSFIRFDECKNGGVGSTEDGVFYNTAGALVVFNECDIGDGSANVLTISGANSAIDKCTIEPPIEFVGAAVNCLVVDSFTVNSVTMSDSSAVTFNSHQCDPFVRGNVVPGLIQNSTGIMGLLKVSVTTNNATAIDGTGAGLVFTNGLWLAIGIGVNPALTINDITSVTFGANAWFSNLSFDRGATYMANDGDLFIGDGAGNPQIAPITPGPGINVINGPGSIELALLTSPVGTTHNLGITYSAGTLSVTASDGTALSASNPGYVVLSSKSNKGGDKIFTITSNQSFIDATGASEIIGNLFGLPTGVAYTNDLPFWIYAVSNDAEDAVAFMASRVPHALTSPAVANIGAPDDPVADTQGSFFSFENIDETLYDVNPCSVIGAFRMTMSAADDWTVLPLDDDDGIGRLHEGRDWTYLSGTFGNAAGSYFRANGGTAPIWGAQNIPWRISLNGIVEMKISCTGNTTAGLGAVAAQLSVPYDGAFPGHTGTYNLATNGGIAQYTSTNYHQFTNLTAFGTVNNVTIGASDFVGALSFFASTG